MAIIIIGHVELTLRLNAKKATISMSQRIVKMAKTLTLASVVMNIGVTIISMNTLEVALDSVCLPVIKLRKFLSFDSKRKMCFLKRHSFLR